MVVVAFCRCMSWAPTSTRDSGVGIFNLINCQWHTVACERYTVVSPQPWQIVSNFSHSHIALTHVFKAPRKNQLKWLADFVVKCCSHVARDVRIGSVWVSPHSHMMGFVFLFSITEQRRKVKSIRDGWGESINDAAKRENKEGPRERCERRATWIDVESRLYAGELATKKTTTTAAIASAMQFTFECQTHNATRSFISTPVYLVRCNAPGIR